jgi:CBS domain-containing protein
VPYLLSLQSIVVFFVLFSLAAAVTAGCAIPSGLLMPQMIIGGCLGRALSLITVQIQTALHQYPADSDASLLWSALYSPFFADGGPLSKHPVLTPSTSGYLDPGIGAVVGAAAFLGGSGRVTLFTTVMMVEITGDPVMIFPVGFATVFAVLVGNALNHGLYHALIDVQSQPYLPDTWQSDELPPGVTVKDMMPANDPIVIPLNGGIEGINAAISGNNYTGFPLVNDDGAVLGMVAREPLLEFVQQASPVTSDKLKYVSDLHPLTVRQDFPLQMAYNLFKAMDMRNLVVVDDHHRPLAVMTRFAFLAWRVKERLGDRFDVLMRMEEERRMARARARSWGSQSPSPPSSPLQVSLQQRQ